MQMQLKERATPAFEFRFSEKHQKTLKKSVSVTGLGLFTREKSTVTLHPSDAGGIVFMLPGGHTLPALASNVLATPRCTILGNSACKIQTVEHLLSAVRALEIDHACIEVSGSEIPILDGSALSFVELIESVGTDELAGYKSIGVLQTPLFWSCGETTLVALPSEELRISSILHYPQSPLIGTQFFSFNVERERFKSEIAPARTFCLYEEIAPLIENGWLKGGGLDCAVVVKENEILNPEGLRLPNEMVRHKILDFIGDLSLTGFEILAHFHCLRSGHAANVAFAKILMEKTE